jgi:hypothetical protein
MANYSFRFQNLEIWKKSVEIGMKLFDIADDLDKRRLYRKYDYHLSIERSDSERYKRTNIGRT